MNKTKINKIIVASFFFVSLGSFAQDQNSSQNNQSSQNDDASKITENNPNVEASKFLSSEFVNEYQGRIRSRDNDVFEEPLSMNEAENLTHPYFKDIMNEIEGTDLDELAKLTDDSKFNRLRLDSIYNEGLKFGTQNAFYEIIYEFNKDLEEIGDDYDRIFDFNSLMLADGRVIPPVILPSGESVTKEDNRTIRRTKSTLQIVKQAEVALRPPSYIDYLTFDPISPSKPRKYLLPRPDIKEEVEEWRKGVREGWLLGVRQASNIINEGLYKLARDYVGMGEFYLAHTQGSISKPQYQDMNIGIVTDGETLKIGEEVFSIEVLPEFNSDARNWEPLPRVDDFLEINW